MKEPKLRSGDFSPQFSVKHMLKDVRLAVDLGKAGQLPLAGSIRNQLARAAEAGFSEEDMAALIKVL
jgi:3-hydroxyisobutyrate dehydrogenase-like beta-hydroxyacid dehydrogenase